MRLRICRFRGGIGSLLLAVIALQLLLAVGAFAQADTSMKNRVTLDVVDADLVRVVDMLRSSTNANIIVSRPNEIKAKVSASLRDVTLEAALKAVVEGTDYTWWKDDNGIYYINSANKSQKETQPAVEATNTILPSEPVKEARIEKIKLRYVNPSVVMAQLGLSNGGFDASIYGRVKNDGKVENTSSKIGDWPGKITADEASDPSYRPAEPTPGTINIPKHQSAIVSGRTADENTTGVAGQIGGINRGGGAFGGGTAGGFGGGMGAGMGQFGGGTRTGFGGAGGAGMTGTGAGQNKLLPDDIYMVMPYETDNSLVVRGTDVAIDELKQVIRMLDVAPKQVMIKAEYVQLTVSDEDKLGIDWTVQTMNASASSTGLNQGGTLAIRYGTGNIDATLGALKSSSLAKVKNSPIISTINNVPALIDVGSQYVYFTSYTTTPSNGSPITEYNPQQIDVDTSLWVLPRVNGDGTITVTIMPTVEDVVGMKNSPNGDQVPITTHQTLNTTRRVADGETIVVGGLNNANKTTTVNGLPFLQDLPLVGQFFRSKDITNDDKELLIFLTPTVLPEPASSSGISNE